MFYLVWEPHWGKCMISFGLFWNLENSLQTPSLPSQSKGWVGSRTVWKAKEDTWLGGREGSGGYRVCPGVVRTAAWGLGSLCSLCEARGSMDYGVQILMNRWEAPGQRYTHTSGSPDVGKNLGKASPLHALPTPPYPEGLRKMAGPGRWGMGKECFTGLLAALPGSSPRAALT